MNIRDAKQIRCVRRSVFCFSSAGISGVFRLASVLGTVYTVCAWGGVNDPVAYWDFEDAATVLSNRVTSDVWHDASVLVGEPTSGLTAGAAGIVGNALVLDGSSAIRLPYNQDSLGESFTIAMWYWQTTNDTRMCVFSSQNNYNIEYGAPSYNTRVFSSYVAQIGAGDVTTPLRAWTHIAQVFSTTAGTTTISVYTNGVFVFSKSADADDMFVTRQILGLYVGSYRDKGRYLQGMVDEVALWNRALTADDVQAVYQRGLGGNALEVTPEAAPSGITLASGQLSYVLDAEEGKPPAGVSCSDWMSGVIQPPWPFQLADTSGAYVRDSLGYVPDTADSADGPFNAEITDLKYRIPMTATLRQLPEGDFTLETWFRTTSTARGTLLGNFGDGTGAINLELTFNNYVRLYVQPRTGTTTDLSLSAGAVNTRDGKWHHLAGIRKGSVVYVYLDGAEVGHKDDTAGSFDLAGSYFYLARDARTSTTIFDGEMGQARLWTRALAVSELAVLTACGLPGGDDFPRTDLLAEYSLYQPFDGARTVINYNTTANLSLYQVALTPRLRQLTLGDFTAESWFRTTNENRGILIGCYTNSDTRAINLELHTDNRVRFFQQISSTTAVDVLCSAGSVNTRDGYWHHLAGVRSNGTIRVYVDGLQVGTQASNAVSATAYTLQTDCLRFKRDNRPGCFIFDGDIGSARLWTRGLSGDEIASLAASGAPGNGTVSADDLLAEWTLHNTNSLAAAGFQGTRFLRTTRAGTNTLPLIFKNLPHHSKIGIGLLLAQLDALKPASAGDHFDIRIDGNEILSVGLGYGADSDPAVNAVRLFGQTADIQTFESLQTLGGTELFQCGDGTLSTTEYPEHVYDLSQWTALQHIPHTSGTLTLELVGCQSGSPVTAGFAVDQVEITFEPVKGTLISVQ